MQRQQIHVSIVTEHVDQIAFRRDVCRVERQRAGQQARRDVVLVR